MISHRYRCIFIHIPRTAGTSVESALGHFQGEVSRGDQDHRSIRIIRRPLLNPAILHSVENLAEVLRSVRYRFRSYSNPNNAITVTSRQYREYFKFTVVRDPWNRIYSAYRNLTTDEFHRRNLGITGNPSLRSFLRRFAGRDMLRPQTYWISDFDGRIPLDYIIRFEDLESGFREVAARLGDETLSLPYQNKGGSGSYRDRYDHDTAAMVREYYREEIEIFGYSFQSP